MFGTENNQKNELMIVTSTPKLKLTNYHTNQNLPYYNIEL